MKCIYCGKEIATQTGRGRKRKYCSDNCRRSADVDNKRIHYIGKRQKYCITCGIELPKYKTKYCSRRCMLIHSGVIENHGELKKKCEICGKEFNTFKSKKVTCSERCSAIRSWRIREYKGIKIDFDINLKKLSKKNNNVCQICGKAVDWSDFKIVEGKTICGDYYPSIDHIVPISKGGLHKWDNVQLAHRICNTKKRDIV